MAVAVAERPSRSRRRRFRKDTGRSFLFTFVVVVVLAAFLAPVLRSLAVSLRTPQQVGQADSPQYPAVPLTFDYNGETYDLYTVPIDGAERVLALVKPGRTQSQFIDPANVAAGPITWDGSWRTLSRSWSFSPAFQNYVDVWNLIDYPRLLLNTILIAVIGMIGTVVSCTLVAYGFARFRFPGRTLLFGALLFTMMVPGMVLLIPQFVLAKDLGLLNSLVGLVVVYAVMNLGLNTFLLRGFFATMPQEIFDAADVDGAGVWGTFRLIALPLAKPGLATVTLFSFLAAWDEFTWAIVTLSDQKLYTLPVAIRAFQRAQATEWGLVFAASLIALVPVLCLFVLLQRQFVSGAFVGAAKG